MVSTPSSAPEWLRHPLSSPHLVSVVRALSERERARTIARNTSRQRSNSKSQRNPYTPTHILASLLNKPDHAEHYSVSVGSNRDLQECNRYLDITPYDRTRVVLSGRGVERGSAPDGRYLNANWVRELAGGKWWIASQAPLPNTAHAFLSVMLSPIVHPNASRTSKTSRVRTVVQLTQNVESGMRKAHVYFPDAVGKEWVVPPEEGLSTPPLKVTLRQSSYVEDAKCVLSRVSVEPSGGQATIFQHLLYASWPDHGVPTDEDRASLLRFTRFVDEVNRDLSSQSLLQSPPPQDELDPDPPIIVNCSAGIGRTGSFIALSSLLRKFGFLPPPASPLSLEDGGWKLTPSPLGPLPEELREDLVAQEIDMLREQRPGMVQRDSQVAFIYEMLIAAFAEQHAT
ncbi:protein-tyrosine phosphatase-like protein [Rhodofomes roseus]|uniref:Protein-tyrosine phosphatase-like protein n=1 Tax=Rhodofomes roseus TaxID=34475 RepID=A0ABQ8KJ29_9APHY|nr:protein-tyrosine phosphatase-like protein [Rhodofomes roseus]KAH9837388.1 protein-tyrosine phosphatase-like protein [Rhodofomes roseus]